MKFEAWGKTDVGLKRESNQDSILVDSKLGLFIVADGMGGHRGGEVASAMAVESAHEVFEDQAHGPESHPPAELVRLAYREASRKIYLTSTKEKPELMGMGTTMVLVYARANTFYFGNVGDSRVYLFKDDHLWQITEDHSLVNEQVKAGILDPSDQAYAMGKNVITRSVGFEEEVITDVVEREVYPGEIYLLCSDGLSGMVTNAKIQEICKKRDPRAIVDHAIEAAKAGGGDDNVSVIVIKILS
jgi:protein phosphatase